MFWLQLHGPHDLDHITSTAAMGKQCRACLKVKPTTDFKWRIGPQGNKYQDTKCEYCWINTDMRKAEAESCATKVCSACKEEKLRDEFFKDVRFIGMAQ